MYKDRKDLYTLIPLNEFKAILSIDDREDRLSKFCLCPNEFTVFLFNL